MLVKMNILILIHFYLLNRPQSEGLFSFAFYYLFIFFVQAMNTGHDGSLSTGHANSTADMISRLETMVLSGADLPLGVVRQQIASAIDIFIHLSRLRDRSRRVTEISEVVGMKEGEVVLNPLYQFQEKEERSGRIIGALEHTGRQLLHTEKLSMAGMSGGSPARAGDGP